MKPLLLSLVDIKFLFLLVLIPVYARHNAWSQTPRVGIGESSPSKALHLKGGRAIEGCDIDNTNAGNGDPIIHFQLNGTNSISLGCDDADNDQFKIGTSSISTGNLMCIKSDGNVGWGVSNPGFKLIMSRSDATKSEAVFENTDVGGDIGIGFMTNASRRFTLGVDNADDEFKIGTTAVDAAVLIRINPAGYVGFGAQDPTVATVEIADAAGGELLLVRDDATTANTETLGGIGFSSNDGSVGTDISFASTSIKAFATEDHSSTNKGAKLVFYTSPIGRADNVSSTPTMEIDQNGNVGIGVSSPDHILQVNSTCRSTQATFDTSSDIRVKENIKDFNNGLAIIMKLRPVIFDWKQEYRKPNKTLAKHDMGFIAQEVELVEPSMVKYTKEQCGNKIIYDFHLLNTSNLNPIIVKAIQEQQYLIEGNNDLLQTMEMKANSMNERLDKIEKTIK